jgi:hypothetical protein
MKRLIVFLFALLLPVQFAWAGAAAYCGHETTPAQTRHFGHHEHVHQASSEVPSGGQLAIDADCGVCHAPGSLLPPEALGVDATAPSSSAAVPHPLRPLPTTLARAPDRPQWLRLA